MRLVRYPVRPASVRPVGQRPHSLRSWRTTPRHEPVARKLRRAARRHSRGISCRLCRRSAEQCPPMRRKWPGRPESAVRCRAARSPSRSAGRDAAPASGPTREQNPPSAAASRNRRWRAFCRKSQAGSYLRRTCELLEHFQIVGVFDACRLELEIGVHAFRAEPQAVDVGERGAGEAAAASASSARPSCRFR